MDSFTTLDVLGKQFLQEHLIPKGFAQTKSLERELLLFISEVIEVFEDTRKGLVDSTKIPGFSVEEEEAADLVIRVLAAAAQRGWRIGDAARAKHQYNVGRPDKHGKSF